MQQDAVSRAAVRCQQIALFVHVKEVVLQELSNQQHILNVPQPAQILVFDS